LHDVLQLLKITAILLDVPPQLRPADPPCRRADDLHHAAQLLLVPGRVHHDEPRRDDLGPPPPALARERVPLAPAPLDDELDVRRVQGEVHAAVAGVRVADLPVAGGPVAERGVAEDARAVLLEARGRQEEAVRVALGEVPDRGGQGLVHGRTAALGHLPLGCDARDSGTASAPLGEVLEDAVLGLEEWRERGRLERVS